MIAAPPRIISGICLIFCVGLTGCAINSISQLSETEEATGIISQPPMVSSQVVTHDLALNDDLNSIDYNRYLKKIWVVKDWDGGSHNYHTSFFITKIEDGVIEGEFITGAVARRCSNPPLPLGEFSGTISNGIAECLFIKDDGYSDENGFKAKTTLVFKEENVIEGNIEYAKKLNEVNFKNGNYLCKPYNLADIIGLQRNRSYQVDLDDWGSVYVTTAVNTLRDTIYPVAYLTNENDDILYEFISSLFQFDTEIANVMVDDINDDGIKDIRIITGPIDQGSDSLDTEKLQTEWIFYQSDNGLFYEGNLDAVEKHEDKQGDGSPVLRSSVEPVDTKELSPL